MDSKLPQRIHIIGICGVATSALAIAFHKAGIKVTGSDKGFYPPVSTELEKHRVPFYAGWHPEKIAENGRPDLIVAGASGTSPSNPEVVYAKERSIPILSFAEALGRFIIRRRSIVAAGTWGKTASSAILSFILIEAGMDPSYFTGGVSLSHPTAAMTDSDWSVVEGDEYQAAIWDKKAKFFYYKPTHLLLTSVSWDHADLYPTEESYFGAFQRLVTEMPSDGQIIANNDQPGVLRVLNRTHPNKKDPARTGIITYGSVDANYRYDAVKHTKQGLDFTITHDRETWDVRSPLLGRFNAENITGCFAMAHSIGVPAPVIIKAIAGFKGIKRRLEKRFEGDVTVLDCHAPTPEKAVSVLRSIREVYDARIIAVFEPNIGGRVHGSAAKYDNAFRDADIVVIPRLTKLKVSEKDGSPGPNRETPMDGAELTKVIMKTHQNVVQIDADDQLVAFLTQRSETGDVIAFLGSHGFRGMIEETIRKSA